MLNIKMEGLDDVRRELGDLQKKLPSVIARALTFTANDAKKQVEGWLPRVFDRPTPYTIRSLFVFPAEKNDLRAAVGFKSKSGRLSRSEMGSFHASASMRSQVYGGQRQQKDSEKSLIRAGILKGGGFDKQFLIPAIGAKRDRFGNVPGSFMNKVLYSGVSRGSASQGYASPMNARGRSNSSRGDYFIMRGKFGHRAVGIFKNVGRSKPPMPVFLFSTKAVYKTKLPFDRIAAAEVDRMLSRRVSESIDFVIKKYR